MKPHKHAELIHAWADGAEIECRLDSALPWQNMQSPYWAESLEYRIKPERVYPKSSLSGAEAYNTYTKAYDESRNYLDAMQALANAAVKQYIQEQGQK